MPTQAYKKIIVEAAFDETITSTKTDDTQTRDSQGIALQSIAYALIQILAKRDTSPIAAANTIHFVAPQTGTLRSFYEQVARPPGRHPINRKYPY